MASSSKDFNSSLSKFENVLKTYFVDKAPFQIPTGAKEFIVQYGPWITLVLLILAIPALLALLGFAAALSPFAALGGARPGVGLLSVLLSVIALILEAMALPGLFRRSKAGWNLLFYSSMVSAIDNLISLNIGGLIIGLLIGWYILFQVRSYYK